MSDEFKLSKPIKRTLSAKDKAMRTIPEHVLEAMRKRQAEQKEDKRG